ncbi:MAG: Hsp20/alpha crystallin family protein [Anaerofustis sp.]
MFDLTPFDKRTNSIFNYMDNLDKNFFGDLDMRGLSQMKTDIIDKGDRYLVQAELPGFNKEEIHIDIKDNYLTVHAEHREEKEEKKENYIRKERRYGSYERSFDISDVNADQIEAKYNDGVLELQMPKLAEKPIVPKSIQVK